ncbi:MAG: transporter substrate-binding domain-containing protein [Pseudomonadales bacterium]|nr:transporter substrate-binding domain-containing protein [Pseudomonadales bacterium]
MLKSAAYRLLLVGIYASLPFSSSIACGDDQQGSASNGIPQLQDQVVLKLGHNNSLGMPLRWQQANGKYTGPMIDIMEEISRRSGVKLEFVPMPFARTWEMVKQGRFIEGGFGNYYTEDRAEYATYFFPALGFFYNRLYTHAEVGNPVATLDGLKGKSVVKLIGHSISREFDAAVKHKSIEVIEVSSYDSMLEMLQRGRAHYAAAPQFVFDTLIRDNSYEETVVKTNLLLSERATYFYLSKQAQIPDRDRLIETLQRTMREMERDRYFEKAHEKFGTSYKRSDLGRHP